MKEIERHFLEWVDTAYLKQKFISIQGRFISFLPLKHLIQLLIYIIIVSLYLFYTLGYNTVLYYSLCGSNYSSFDLWKLFKFDFNFSLTCHLLLFFCGHPYILVLKGAPESPWIFPVPILE